MKWIVTLEAIKEVVVEADTADEAFMEAKDTLLCESDWDDIYAQDGMVYCKDTVTYEQVDIAT